MVLEVKEVIFKKGKQKIEERKFWQIKTETTNVDLLTIEWNTLLKSPLTLKSKLKSTLVYVSVLDCKLQSHLSCYTCFSAGPVLSTVVYKSRWDGAVATSS